MNGIGVLALITIILVVWVIFRLNQSKIIGKRGERNVNFNLHFFVE